MSEETENNDGTWSGLKKTIIGTISTAILAGGTYVTTQLFGGGDEEETKTEQAAPAPAPVIINVQQNQENKQQVKQGGGTNTIIKEKVVEKPAKAEPVKEEEPW